MNKDENSVLANAIGRSRGAALTWESQFFASAVKERLETFGRLENLKDLESLGNLESKEDHAMVNAHLACEPIDLVPGLPVAKVREKLNIGVRMQDTGARLVAFYLVEMDARRLYQSTGHSSTVHYAECRLSLEPRRSRELLAVGRKLLELPAMDEAFCGGEIGWSQVVLLTRVATPEHEEAWLERARESTCRELGLEVKMSRPGSKPRDPEDRKGLAEIRFPIATQISGLAFQMWELAKKQLGEERGAPISDALCMELLAALLLSTEEDGSLPGRKHARSSLFRLVVHQGAAGDEQPRASLETEEGAIPLDQPTLACIQCDAEAISDDGERLEGDSKTSAAMRERVLTRDGHRCRACQSRFELMVHHIHARADRGRTRPDNLITLCMRCHGLVHADFLVLEGKHQARVRFKDREGTPLHDKGKPLAPSVLTRLDHHRVREALGEPMGQALSRSLARRLAANPETGIADDADTPTCAATSRASMLTQDDLPTEVDVHWWRKHAHLFHEGKNGRFRFEAGFAVMSPRIAYLLGEQGVCRQLPSESQAPWSVRIGNPDLCSSNAMSVRETADVRRLPCKKEEKEWSLDRAATG